MERSTGQVRQPDWAQAFLIRLAIALNKTIAYPPGHPSLEGELESIARELTERLAGGAPLEFGVARDQLILSDGGTDARHPLLSGLADRLHRQHIAAVRMSPGMGVAELAAFLNAVAARTEDGEPLGHTAPQRQDAWSNITIRPLEVGELAIAGDAGTGTLASSVWRALAAAALRDEKATWTTVRGEDIARAIARNLDDQEYIANVAARLRDVAPLLGSRAAGSDLARGIGALLSTLDVSGAQALLRAIGDPEVRRRMVLDTVQAVPADAVVPLVESAAAATQETLSHSLLRLLTKLAAQAGDRQSASSGSDETLREVAIRLVDQWTLEDPNPEEYRSMLAELAGRRADRTDASAIEDPDVRIVSIALETDTIGPIVRKSIDALIAKQMFDTLVDILDAGDPAAEVAALIRQRMMSAAQLAAYLSSDAVSDRVIARLVEWSDGGVAGQLLDALAAADSRSARRRLMATLTVMGGAIAGTVIERLDRGEWFVQRNMLNILGEMDPLPPDFSPLRYLDHNDARVRREALRIAARLPTERTAALKRSLADANPQVVNAALSIALSACPAGIVADILRIADDSAAQPDTRESAVRVAGVSGDPRAVRWLLDRIRPPRWVFWRKLRSTPDAPLLIAALVSTRDATPEVRAVLQAAAVSRDPAVRTAATGSTP